MVDLVGGHLMMRFDQLSTSIAHIRADKLRALAVTSRKRSVLLPNVPTVDESGLPGFFDTTFNGIVAPAGTPADIVRRLHAEVKDILATREVQSRLIAEGSEPGGIAPDAFAEHIRREIARWAAVVKIADRKSTRLNSSHT